MELISAIIGVVGTILGTVLGAYLGFSLSERATRSRQEQSDREQARSVRTVIRIEINRNLTHIQILLNEIAQEESRFPHDTQGKRAALRSVNLPLWSHAIWEAQLPLAAKALTESEIDQVLEFHSKLDNLSVTHIDLQSSADNIDKANRLYHQFMELANKLGVQNNPVTK